MITLCEVQLVRGSLFFKECVILNLFQDPSG